ncbi:hypothetical protein [Natronorarus salvus]|uniref:hypothetical protein n=1 Tax=Natronorarus salvus TaxID=3117733 RepID=UPI003907EA48
MSRRRALLTDKERERIASTDVEGREETYRYQAISRVRNKIHDELPKDIEILREHHPDLLEELREEVCDG